MAERARAGAVLVVVVFQWRRAWTKEDAKERLVQDLAQGLIPELKVYTWENNGKHVQVWDGCFFFFNILYFPNFHSIASKENPRLKSRRIWGSKIVSESMELGSVV
jgi:hypothetical protein